MLSPTELPAEMKDQMSTRLPKGKTIVDVFADFMGYLFESTKVLFISSDPAAEIRWNSVSNNVELVLTHPNGWGGSQQSKLRTAAVQAGIVPDTQEGRSRVHFVTEGEASFNFCVTHTQAGKDLKVRRVSLPRAGRLTRSQPDEQVLIIDAGGGTIDISTYKVLSSGPLQVEELYQPECERINRNARFLPFDSSFYRLIPGRRVRYSEGESDGTRCVLTFGSFDDCSAYKQGSSERPNSTPPGTWTHFLRGSTKG